MNFSKDTKIFKSFFLSIFGLALIAGTANAQAELERQAKAEIVEATRADCLKMETGLTPELQPVFCNC